MSSLLKFTLGTINIHIWGIGTTGYVYTFDGLFLCSLFDAWGDGGIWLYVGHLASLFDMLYGGCVHVCPLTLKPSYLESDFLALYLQVKY